MKETATKNSELKTQDSSQRRGGGCGVCVCAMGVWNGRRDWLLCANYPGHEGELSHVSGTGIVVDCRRFCRKWDVAAVEVPAGDGVRYISLGSGRAALVDAADFEWLSRHTWRAEGGSGYATSKIGGRMVRMHRLIMNPAAGFVVDHINGNKEDNRRKNLRVCTRAQNARNRRKRCGTSRFKGVSWNAAEGKWVACIQRDGKTIRLGLYDDEVEAARAYDRMAIELFGEFACLNFPQRIRIVHLSGRIEAHSLLRGRIRTFKFEIRDPKLETSSNARNSKSKTEHSPARAFRSLRHLGFGHCFEILERHRATGIRLRRSCRNSYFEFPRPGSAGSSRGPPGPWGIVLSKRLAERRRSSSGATSE